MKNSALISFNLTGATIINNTGLRALDEAMAHNSMLETLLRSQTAMDFRMFRLLDCRRLLMAWLLTYISQGSLLMVRQVRSPSQCCLCYGFDSKISQVQAPNDAWYSISDEFYQHCKLRPIYGMGQGSGNSPVIWCVISSVLFDCHATSARGATYTYPDGTESITLYMVGFVDDSTGQTNFFTDRHEQSPDKLLTAAEQDAQLWSDLLWCSGGALEFPKCTYQFLHWTSTQDGSPIISGHQVCRDLILQSSDRTITQTITFRSAHSTHKTLGYYKDPAGNLTKQFEILKAKSDKAAIFVASSPLNQRDTWVYYFSIYLTSIGYPFIALISPTNS
jgi:hypothetical protein